jgi:hypothetical protein
MSFFQRNSEASSSPKTTIEIVLMLDISYSMDDELNAAKMKLAELSAAMSKSNPDATVRVAVIAYSDYQDDVNYHINRHNPDYWLKQNTSACSVCDFSDTTTANKFLNKLSTENGYDEAEAMELALYKARHLQWTAAKSGDRIIRQVFIVSDALPHAASNKRDYRDDFHTVAKIPSQLDWREQVAELKKLGIEIHVLETEDDLAPRIHAVNLQIAGSTGTVSTLSKADELIAKVTQVVQAEDELDELIGKLTISAKDTEEEIDELTGIFGKTKIDPVQVISTTYNVPTEAAAAKIASHQNRYAGAPAAKTEDDKEEKKSLTPAKNPFALGRW